MGWYALEEIGEALEETRDLLLPFDIKTWTKLAVIVLLTGSGMNLPSTGFPGPQTDTGQHGDMMGDSTQVPEYSTSGISVPELAVSGGEFTGISSSAAGAVVAVLLILFIFIVLPLILLGSIFEFIFYKSLIDKDVNISKNFSDNLGNGLRYFAFRVIYMFLALAMIGAAILLGMTSDALLVAVILAMIPVFLVLTVFAGLTHDFVLLRMLEQEEGLLEAWRSFWPELISGWKQVLVYIFTKFFLQLFVGVASATIILMFTVSVAIPVVIAGFLLSLIAEVLFVIPLLLGVILWLIALLYIGVPFRVYIYYYIILVYHDLSS